MRIGIGLPTAVPDAGDVDLPRWAAEAEDAGFATIAVVDRLAYQTLDPFVALTAAAVATRGCTLTTSVLLAPLRRPAQLIKEVAAVQQVAGGRFVLGLGVGNRADDYTAASADFHRRGRLLDAIIARLSDPPADLLARPLGVDVADLRLGGGTDAALARVARLGCSWIYGGPDVEGFATTSERLTARWRAAGRPDQPRRSALAFVSLGRDPADAAARHIDAYYRYAPFRDQLRDGVPTSPDDVRRRVEAFAALGCEELLLFPCTGQPVEIDRLASAVGLTA